MSGGLIRVRGNAGGQIGAAYRGSLTGMTDGTILIGGTAGLEVGMRMKRGIIVIGGLVRDFAGLQMKGGTHRPAQRRRASDRRLDDPRHDHLAEADQAPADVFVRVHLQPHVPAPLRQAPGSLGFPIPYEDQDGGLPALHRRRRRARQRRNSRSGNRGPDATEVESQPPSQCTSCCSFFSRRLARAFFWQGQLFASVQSLASARAGSFPEGWRIYAIAAAYVTLGLGLFAVVRKVPRKQAEA